MDEIKCQYIDVLAEQEQEIVSLKQQVSVLQKVHNNYIIYLMVYIQRVANGELETEMLKKSLEHEVRVYIA